MLNHPFMQLTRTGRVETLREALKSLVDLAAQQRYRPLGVGLIDFDPFDPHPGKVRDQLAFKPVYALQRVALIIRPGDVVLLHGPEGEGADDVRDGVVPTDAAVARQAPEMLHGVAGARPAKLFAQP